jgi:aspartate carbamoyltransferase regulatory subunit
MITYVQSWLLYKNRECTQVHQKVKQRMYAGASEGKTISCSTCDTYLKYQNSHALY